MKECRYADKYLALFRPRCNAGKGCDACNVKWQAAQLQQVRHEQEQHAESNGKSK